MTTTTGSFNRRVSTLPIVSSFVIACSIAGCGGTSITNPSGGGGSGSLGGQSSEGGAANTGGSTDGVSQTGGNSNAATTSEQNTGGSTGVAQGTGGNATGGTATGGAATGGMTTSGEATGGSATGGMATGGTATGGAATGGSTNFFPNIGGMATGGNATGGAATGGNTGFVQTATGGASMGGQATGGQATGGQATGGQATGGQATGGQATGGSSASSSTAIGGTHSGQATYYDYNNNGHCSFTSTYNNQDFAALNSSDYGSATWCGACADVTGPKGTVTQVIIVDECPSCAAGDLDLKPAAFDKIADHSAGRVQITWKFVPCNVSGPIQYHYKEGSSVGWTSVQVVNSRLPVSKMEYSTDGGNTWKSMTRQTYNYFEVQSGFGGAAMIRLTASTGETLTESLPSPTSNATVTGTKNF